MPYELKQQGKNWQVVKSDTGEVKAIHKPPEAKKKAQAQITQLDEQEFVPDRTTTLSNGTKVNIKYKNKESYSGAIS